MSTRRRNRGAPRGQRATTARDNAKIIHKLAKGGRQADLARERAENSGNLVDAAKQRIYRARRDGIRIPEDVQDIETLLNELDQAS